MSKGKISPELLQKIKESVNLIDIVGEHVVLRKSGTNHSGLCPFHSERSPSFSVSESKQLYHCYGCKKGGDLISFVMEIYGVSFTEAIRDLAERGQVQLPKELNLKIGSDEKQSEMQERTATAFKLNRFVAAYFHHLLDKLPEHKKYLNQRGVTENLVKEFYLGASLPEWEGLAQHLVSKKAPMSLALELGLVRPSSKDKISQTGYFDLFRNRLIFPIINTRGKVAGFGGRLMPKEEGPKYLNSSDSFIFQKSKLVFGLYQAQKHIRELDEVVIVEGYFDVLALHAAGFKNAVSTCGTALTADHLNILRRFGQRVVILFDGDRAGVEATERAMELGLDQGIVLYGAQLAADKDPDEILFDQNTGEALSGGVEEMKAVFVNAKPILDQKLEDEMQRSFKSTEERAQAVKKIGSWLERFKDPVGRELRIQLVCKKLEVGRNLFGFKSEPRHQQQSRAVVAKPPLKSATIPSKTPTKMSRAEKVLLEALIRQGQFASLLDRIGSKLPPKSAIFDLFEYPPAKEFVREHHHANKEPNTPANTLIDATTDPLVRSVVTESLLRDEPSFTIEDLQSLLEQKVSRIWARFSHGIKSELDAAEAKKDTNLQSVLMKEYLDVQRKMKELNYFYDN